MYLGNLAYERSHQSVHCSNAAYSPSVSPLFLAYTVTPAANVKMPAPEKEVLLDLSDWKVGKTGGWEVEWTDGRRRGGTLA